MGRRIPTPRGSDGRGQPVDPGPGQGPCPATQTQEGPTLNIGPLFARTVRHFFPPFNSWIDAIEDPRFLPFVVYDNQFLLWLSVMRFACKLGSRRQLDYQFDGDGPAVLDNLERLVGTAQMTRPANKTLEYFLGRVGSDPVAGLVQKMVNRLVRMKTLDEAHLQGDFADLHRRRQPIRLRRKLFRPPRSTDATTSTFSSRGERLLCGRTSRGYSNCAPSSG